MNNFKKGGFRQGGGGSGGRPKFGGKFGGGRDGGNRSGARPELFPAVCSDCRKNCEVPFRPTGDKPVYCRDCFGKQRKAPGQNPGGNERPGGDFRRDARPQYEHQPERAVVPSEGGIEALKRQLMALETKVNRILEILSPKIESPISKPLFVEESAETAKEPKVKADTAEAKAPVRKVAKKVKK